ncbi:hypothetical protein BaRGS_00004286 [Batillaria attramentaria]|uniref:Uncharacterized protein n=1 Tax=Batillaria attramentaria TaxID=370345 RepID=A0ABD0LYY1_9CAEN
MGRDEAVDHRSVVCEFGRGGGGSATGGEPAVRQGSAGTQGLSLVPSHPCRACLEGLGGCAEEGVGLFFLFERGVGGFGLRGP